LTDWHYNPFQDIVGGNGHPTLETSCGLLAVDPDVAEPLAVVALCEASLHFVCFDLYNDVAEVKIHCGSKSMPGSGKLFLLNSQVRSVWSPFALC